MGATTLGGSPVIKNWMSYEEEAGLGRHLELAEVADVTDMYRGIATLLLLDSNLDPTHHGVNAETVRL